MGGKLEIRSEGFSTQVVAVVPFREVRANANGVTRNGTSALWKALEMKRAGLLRNGLCLPVKTRGFGIVRKRVNPKWLPL